MFEFPQHYAYFLLPFGFIVGTVLAQNPNIKTVTLPSIAMKLIFGLGLLLLIVIYRDYDVAVPKLGQSIRYEQQPEKSPISSQSIY